MLKVRFKKVVKLVHIALKKSYNKHKRTLLRIQMSKKLLI